MDAVSEANGNFAFRLFKELCQDNPDNNVFISPMSISSALAMVLLGAKGNTTAQIAQVSHPAAHGGAGPQRLLLLPRDTAQGECPHQPQGGLSTREGGTRGQERRSLLH